MRNFFDNLRYRLQQFMQGRYGTDEFNRFLSFAAIILLVPSFFRFLWRPLIFFYAAALAVIIYMIFRAFSKNIYARSKERDFYVKIKGKVISFFRLQKRRWTERKTHRFYRCPQCRTVVRVPRGRGRIQITCPKCRTQFIKKS